MRKFTLIALLAIAAATPALAGGVSVRFDDLDLTSVAGKSELDSRIHTAAARICSNEEQTGTRVPSRSCLDDVRKQILEQIEARQRRAAKEG